MRTGVIQLAELLIFLDVNHVHAFLSNKKRQNLKGRSVKRGTTFVHTDLPYALSSVNAGDGPPFRGDSEGVSTPFCQKAFTSRLPLCIGT